MKNFIYAAYRLWNLVSIPLYLISFTISVLSSINPKWSVFDSLEFAQILCLYSFFMFILMMVRPVEYSDEEQWGSFLFYSGCILAYLYHGIATGNIPISYFYPVVGLVAYHFAYAVVSGLVFTFCFWHRFESLGVDDIEWMPANLFFRLNMLIRWTIRCAGLAYAFAVFVPSLGIPIPDVDPDFILFWLIVLEILSSSGVAVSKDRNSPFIWFVNTFVLGFVVAWPILWCVFVQINCPTEDSCFPDVSNAATVLLTLMSLTIFGYLVLSFYVLVNWRHRNVLRVCFNDKF